MIGLWKTKISGYIKDNKRKKTKFKNIIKAKGRILRNKNSAKILNKNLYFQDRFETIYFENLEKQKTKNIVKETTYGKCYVKLWCSDIFSEKETSFTGYFDENFKIWCIYKTNEPLYEYLKNIFGKITIISVEMTVVKGFTDLNTLKFQNFLKNKKSMVKTQELFLWNNTEFFYKKPVQNFELMNLYTYGKRKTLGKKYTNKKIRNETKEELHNLIFEHNLYNNNQEHDLYFTFEEINPKFNGKSILKKHFVNY